MQIYPIKQTCSRTSINHIRRKVKLLWIVIDLTEIAHSYAMTCTLDVVKRRAVEVFHAVVFHLYFVCVFDDVLYPDK